MNYRAGESIPQILSYWLPELISVFIIVALPPLFDAYLVAGLQSTSAYGALGMATNFLHTLVKLSEAIPVAAIAIIGRHNGAKRYAQCGRELVTTFWTTVLLGATQLVIIFFGATMIYEWLGVPREMAIIGAPFLRLRSVGVFLAFVLWAFMGFMRAVKNTRAPMYITLLGTLSYLVCSAVLIQGRGGFPVCGIYGAAIAAIVQYSIMLAAAIWYIRNNPAYQKYLKTLDVFVFNGGHVWKLLIISLPIIIDKSSLAFSYVWLSKMLAPLGTHAIATFDIIKNLERSAIMPAAAFAQVITFLVSNRLGARDPKGAKSNIVKVIGVGFILVGAAVLLLCTYAHFFVSRISPNTTITAFAVPLLRVMSLLAGFDFLQLILAGALRGAGSVKVVMWTRFSCCMFFFLPLSYILSSSSFHSEQVKFGTIYGAFYLNTALMGVIFLICLLRGNWYKKDI